MVTTFRNTRTGTMADGDYDDDVMHYEPFEN